MNLIVTCPKCGQEMIAAVKSLKWIRCERCNKPITISSAKVQATERATVAVIGDRHPWRGG